VILHDLLRVVSLSRIRATYGHLRAFYGLLRVYCGKLRFIEVFYVAVTTYLRVITNSYEQR